MKKKDLTKLIEDKKLLNETLSIMDEIGGYDNEEMRSHYHGNAVGELSSIFNKFDDLAEDLQNAIGGFMYDEELANQLTDEVVPAYVQLMEKFRAFITNFHAKHAEHTDKLRSARRPSTTIDTQRLGNPNNPERLNEKKNK
jgi:hypothetical protein